MKRKFTVAVILFVALSLINVWFSTCVHLMLSKTFTEFSAIKYKDCVVGILSNSQHSNLFLVLELLIFTLILILIVTYNSDKQNYTSRMNKITEYIETPEVAGQNQHGSARWLTEKEKNTVFDTVQLKGKLIDELVEQGYDDLEFMKEK